MMRRFTSGSWVRQAEHGILRVVSLVFSMASAYAIRLFFAPLDAADSGEKVITWAVAVGFGVLGYVVSRGLVHRMMNKESIWAYAPICFLVELVDIACNYVLAASVVQQAWWLQAVPASQRPLLTGITYVVLSAIPLVSLFLAVVDMDMERSNAVTKKPVLGQGIATGQPLVQRASLQPQAGQSGAASAAAKRAAAFANQQKAQGQANGQAAARNLLDDPDKVVAGVQ